MARAAPAEPAGTAPETLAPPLRAEGVGVSLGGRAILAPTTLSFPRGTVTGIVGHNGSGKTTLLRCLARQRAPTTGEVTLGGPVVAFGARAFARRLAYLPQQIPVSTGLTGRELVAFGRYPWHGPLGRVGPQGEAAIAEAMLVSDTTDFADRLVDDLSGGERQRVWIAMLIAQEAGFLVLDEPIAALDLAHQIAVLAVLRDLSRKRHAGIIMVLHDINMAARFCDTIVALRGGTVIAQGAPDTIMRAPVLEAIFAIPMRILGDAMSGTFVAIPA